MPKEKMVRTQIYLTKCEHTSLEKEAKVMELSISEIIRRILDKFFEKEIKKEIKNEP